MKRLFQVTISPQSPQLLIVPEASYANQFQSLPGSPRAQLSLENCFRVEKLPQFSWKQILQIAPGGFAFSAEAWEACEDMYYILKSGSELLAAQNEDQYYIIVNPLDFASPAKLPNEPFDLNGGFNTPIFRIPGHSVTDLFCLTGTGLLGDEFKRCYESFGFLGLEFTEVWSERR